MDDKARRRMRLQSFVRYSCSVGLIAGVVLLAQGKFIFGGAFITFAALFG